MMDHLFRQLERSAPALAGLPPLIVATVVAIGLAALAGLLPRRLGAGARVAGNLMLVAVFALAVWRLVRLDPSFDTLGASVALPVQTVAGDETRVPLAADGHYWIEARVNGSRQRFMVDTGATVTTVSDEAAAAAGIAPDPLRLPLAVRTANGTISARMGQARTLRFGSIEARDIDVIITGATGGLNVLGMNVLSRLKAWRVEDGVLVLTPHTAALATPT